MGRVVHPADLSEGYQPAGSQTTHVPVPRELPPRPREPQPARLSEAHASRALPGPGTASEMRWGAAVISSRHAETAAGPRGGVQSWTAYLAPSSLGPGGPAPRDTTKLAGEGTTAEIDAWAVAGPSDVG